MDTVATVNWHKVAAFARIIFPKPGQHARSAEGQSACARAAVQEPNRFTPFIQWDDVAPKPHAAARTPFDPESVFSDESTISWIELSVHYMHVVLS
jgi:hypothetical protein